MCGVIICHVDGREVKIPVSVISPDVESHCFTEELMYSLNDTITLRMICGCAGFIDT